MAEGQGQAGTGTEGQDPKGSAGQDPTQGQGTGQDPKPEGQDPQGGTDQTTLTPEQLQQALADTRRENAQRRARERELEAKVQEYEQANLSEAEKRENENKALQARTQELEQALQEERAGNKLTAAAGTAGFINPAAAAEMIRPSQIEWDDKGQPTNIDALIKALVEKHPYLVNRSTANGGEGRGTGAASQNDMNSLIRQAAGKG